MPPSYRTLQLHAIAISIASVIYNGAEGAISIAFGAESSSKSLIFFGVQSGIEVASALIVLWRFLAVAKPGEERTAKIDAQIIRFEKIATLTIGSLLILLGLATIATAVSILVLREKPDSSDASLIISASAIVIMIFIWLPKRYLAKALNSSALQGEATCSLSCIQITIVLFIGSLVYRVWPQGWWLDGATSIILGHLFSWEGIKMLRWARDPNFDGGCCSSCQIPVHAIELSIGEGNKDICTCCSEKEACNQSDKCQCPLDVEDCCTPVATDGKKCCTRETVFVRIPDQSQTETIPNAQETALHQDCCIPAEAQMSPGVADTCRSACCSETKENGTPTPNPTHEVAVPTPAAQEAVQDKQDICRSGCCASAGQA